MGVIPEDSRSTSMISSFQIWQRESMEKCTLFSLPPKKTKQKKTRNRLLHENYYYIEKNKKDNKWIKKLSIMKSRKISFQLFISTK